MRRSRLPLPLWPLGASMTMEPVAVPVSGVEVDVSLLHVKCAVDGVEGGVQGEVDFAVGGVEGELVLSVERCGASGGD